MNEAAHPYGTWRWRPAQSFTRASLQPRGYWNMSVKVILLQCPWNPLGLSWPPLVTSGPALVLEKHYQVKMGPLLQFWWACPVPAGARMAWKHTTAPGWSHPHNSKNIILTPSYQFSAFPFLAHLRSSRGVRRPSQGLVLTLWWAVLSVSMPWLLIFSVWLSPLEGGLCFNFLALERWVFLHKLQETRKARSDVHIVSISEISHFKALASSSYTTSEGGKTWLYPSYPQEQLSVHTVG